MPEVDILTGVPQEYAWHPEGDVWTHTKMVLNAAAKLVRQKSSEFSAEEKLIILLSAVTHDFGKPATTEFREDRIKAYGHEAAGVEPARVFLERLTLSSEIKRAVLQCTAHHMRPGQLARATCQGNLPGHWMTRNFQKDRFLSN
jgi:tRNA nucleotidyltransferase (CCA-adding enzyme)